MTNAAKTETVCYTLIALMVLAAMLVLAPGCGSNDGLPADPLVGTWVRDDGYAMELRADGTAEIAGEDLTWYAYETTDGVQLLDVLRGPVQYPATYSLSEGVLTIGTDGPLQAGDYVRAQ